MAFHTTSLVGLDLGAILAILVAVQFFHYFYQHHKNKYFYFEFSQVAACPRLGKYSFYHCCCLLTKRHCAKHGAAATTAALRAPS